MNLPRALKSVVKYESHNDTLERSVSILALKIQSFPCHKSCHKFEKFFRFIVLDHCFWS